MEKALYILILILFIFSLFSCRDSSGEVDSSTDCSNSDPGKIVTVEAVTPTCNTPGLTEGSRYINCKTTVTEQTQIAPYGCIKGDYIIDVETTHTSDGSMYSECIIYGRVIATWIVHSGRHSTSYTLMTHDNTYMIKSLGECTDREIMIADKYYGVPNRPLAMPPFVIALSRRSLFPCL